MTLIIKPTLPVTITSLSNFRRTRLSDSATTIISKPLPRGFDDTWFQPLAGPLAEWSVPFLSWCTIPPSTSYGIEPITTGDNANWNIGLRPKSLIVTVDRDAMSSATLTLNVLDTDQNPIGVGNRSGTAGVLSYPEGANTDFINFNGLEEFGSISATISAPDNAVLIYMTGLVFSYSPLVLMDPDGSDLFWENNLNYTTPYDSVTKWVGDQNIGGGQAHATGSLKAVTSGLYGGWNIGFRPKRVTVIVDRPLNEDANLNIDIESDGQINAEAFLGASYEDGNSVSLYHPEGWDIEDFDTLGFSRSGVSQPEDARINILDIDFSEEDPNTRFDNTWWEPYESPGLSWDAVNEWWVFDSSANGGSNLAFLHPITTGDNAYWNQNALVTSINITQRVLSGTFSISMFLVTNSSYGGGTVSGPDYRAESIRTSTLQGPTLGVGMLRINTHAAGVVHLRVIDVEGIVESQEDEEVTRTSDEYWEDAGLAGTYSFTGNQTWKVDTPHTETEMGLRIKTDGPDGDWMAGLRFNAVYVTYDVGDSGAGSLSGTRNAKLYNVDGTEIGSELIFTTTYNQRRSLRIFIDNSLDKDYDYIKFTNQLLSEGYVIISVTFTQPLLSCETVTHHPDYWFPVYISRINHFRFSLDSNRWEAYLGQGAVTNSFIQLKRADDGRFAGWDTYFTTPKEVTLTLEPATAGEDMDGTYITFDDGDNLGGVRLDNGQTTVTTSLRANDEGAESIYVYDNGNLPAITAISLSETPTGTDRLDDTWWVGGPGITWDGTRWSTNLANLPVNKIGTLTPITTGPNANWNTGATISRVRMNIDWTGPPTFGSDDYLLVSIKNSASALIQGVEVDIRDAQQTANLPITDEPNFNCGVIEMDFSDAIIATPRITQIRTIA